MNSNSTRREFLSCASGAVAGFALGAGGSWALAAPQSEEWAIPLLGDLHIDRLDHHDLEWLKKEHPDDVRQVENYSRITLERTPRLLDVVRQQVKDSQSKTPFVVQLGDLIEGLCGSEALAQQQAGDALELVRKANLGAPLLFTKGNHDISGPGAADVYDQTLIPFMAEHTGQEIAQAAFAREQEGTLVVFYDAYHRDSLDWFSQLLENHRAKRLLFIIHPPVVPYNARATWHIYARPSQQRQRERLLELLGRSRAIVLCGHLHKYSYLVRRTESGRFVQLAISSVASSSDARPRDLIEGVKEYGPDLVKLEPRHSPDTVEQRRQILEAESRFIEQFEYADTWGHAMLNVHGDEVRASVFRGFDRMAWKSLDLAAPLAGD